MAMNPVNPRILAAVASALISVCAYAPDAFGQANPLIGSWRSSGQTGSNGYEITYTELVSFSPNGTYENRMKVAGNGEYTGNGEYPPNKYPGAAGTTIIRGEYRLTSPNTYVFREISKMLCPMGVSCYPAPQLPPDFGTQKQVHFDIIGNQIRVNGVTTYYRVF